MAATGKRHFPHTTPDTVGDAVYQGITGGAAHTTMSTLISGEDETNDVLKTVEAYGFEVVDWGAISSDETLGTSGDSSDILRRITVTEQTAGATLNVYAGTVAGGDLLLTIPAGTVIGTTYELGVTSGNAGGFTIDYDASATAGIIVCVGRFS